MEPNKKGQIAAATFLNSPSTWLVVLGEPPKIGIFTTRDRGLKTKTAHPLSASEGGLGGFWVRTGLPRAVATLHFLA